MTPQQIAMVRETADRIQPVSAEADRLFAGRLSALDPSLHAMFDGSWHGSWTVAGIMDRAVHALKLVERSAPGMEAMARRLEIRGLRYEQYAIIGATLLWTIDQVLGEGFATRIQMAWQSNAERELWFLLGVLSVSGAKP